MTGVCLLAGAGYLYSQRPRPVRYVTAAVDRGDIVEAVGATGALQAVTSVQVGSQVSGTIQSLGADFNTVVKKGQVIARLDPSTFQARLGQAQANLAAARANVDKARADLSDNQQKFQRAQELAAEQLLAQSDLDSARAAFESSQASLKAAQAAVTQSQASVNQAQLDLDHTIIATPIDGVVVNRSVDVGQTVAASLQAPTLFIIANDLSHMQVNATVDEADVGRVQEGQEVAFHVDAHPDQTFVGRVQQVRLQPQTVQNVVSYNTLIAVDNVAGELLPGMTATVSIIARKASNQLRVPASALRFRPEGFEGRRRGGGGAGAPGGSGGGSGDAPSAGPAAGQGGAQRPGGGFGVRNGGGAGARQRQDAASSDGARGAGNGAPAAVNARGLVFVLGADGKPAPMRIETGVTDGQWVEVVAGLSEGQSVVTGIDSGTTAAARPGAQPTPAANNPFSPQRQPTRRTR